MCVFVFYDRRIFSPLLLRSSIKRQKFLVNCVLSCFNRSHRTCFLVDTHWTLMIHKLLRGQARAPKASVGFLRLTLFSEVCVSMSPPEKSPGALSLHLCLVNPSKAPHTGFSSSFLWFSLLFTHTHTHSQMHIHAQWKLCINISGCHCLQHNKIL